MDTTTKVIYLILKEKKQMISILSIMTDILSNGVTEKTLELASEMETSFPEYWSENIWLQVFANSDSISDESVEYAKKEIEHDFSFFDDGKEIEDSPAEKRLWDVLKKEEKGKV